MSVTVTKQHSKQILTFFKKLLTVLLFYCLFLLILFSSIFLNANHLKFYDKQYKKLNLQTTTQLTKEDYHKATGHLLDYMNNKTKVIQISAVIDGKETLVFNEKEISHMKDVKNLYQLLKRMIAVLLQIVFLLLIFIYIQYRKNTYHIFRYFRYALISFGVLVSVVISISLMNFELFWDKFHRILFTNDLWLLDASKDRMINMFPLELFQSLVFNIIGWFVLGLTLLWLVMVIMKKKTL